MADLFRLSDAQEAPIQPSMPEHQPGPAREQGRPVISGILHGPASGCRWRDCPAAYGKRRTVHESFDRRSRRGFRPAMLSAPTKAG